MSNDPSWKSYQELRLSLPELFKNIEGGIRIVSEESEVNRVRDFRNRLVADKSLPDHCKQLGVVFEDEYIMVVRDPVDIPTHGGFRSYLRVLEKPLATPAVIIFALYEGRLVLLHHFRHAVRNWSLELPRGLGTSGNWEEDSARELMEEVGGVILRSDNLGPICTNSGIFGTTANVVFAELKEIDPSKISKEEQDPGIGKIELVTQEQFLKYLHDDRIFDSYTLSAAYLMAAKKLDSNWLKS